MKIMQTLVLAASMAFPFYAAAQGITVSPVYLEVSSGKTMGTVTVSSTGTSTPVQIRIMKWDINDSPNNLSKTSDAVISPPAVFLNKGQEAEIRVIRRTNRRIKDRDCYRLLIDTPPPPVTTEGSFVGLAVRHSVPVCFME